MARGPERRGGGGQPRGTRGAQRGCVASRRPEHARVQCPEHRHGRRAHATCTHREGRAPRYVAVRSCVQRDRHEGTKCTRPGGPCTPRSGHSGTCAGRLAHVQSPTAGTSEAGKQASKQPHVELGRCHIDMHTPKALLTQEACQEHIRKDTQSRHTMQICTQCRYVRSMPFSPLCCSCRAIIIYRVESHSSAEVGAHIVYKANPHPEKPVVEPTFAPL